jgi:hypothetical protein
MKNKKFDSVKMMRDIRDKITRETSNLSDKEFIEKLKTEFSEISKKQKEFLKRKIS